MNKITVFYFKCYDVQSDEMLRSKRPATVEAIKRCNGTPIQEPAQDVDASALDSEGFLARESK